MYSHWVSYLECFCFECRLLIGVEEKINNALWEDKINVFHEFTKKHEEIFIFIHDFFACADDYQYLETRENNE